MSPSVRRGPSMALEHRTIYSIYAGFLLSTKIKQSGMLWDCWHLVTVMQLWLEQIKEKDLPLYHVFAFCAASQQVTKYNGA